VDESTVAETMAQLVAQRSRAQNRVREIEAEERAAHAALVPAREALVQFEAAGNGRPADRQKLEDAFAAARGLALGTPWPERRQGAERAAREAHRHVQLYAGEHLGELVEEIEERGQAAAERLTGHADGVLAEFDERERLAGELSALLALLGQVGPNDVSRSKAEALVAEARRLVENGGERGPTVLRDLRPPDDVAIEEPQPASAA
jgi:hypothetical protein